MNWEHRHVLHPISHKSVFQIYALNEVHHIRHESQIIITERITQWGLGETDHNPITQQDRTEPEATMRAMQDKWLSLSFDEKDIEW